MPTIEDLLAEYASRAHSAPTEVGVRDQVAARRSRRPLVAVAGGVGVVAVVAVAAIVAGSVAGRPAHHAAAPAAAAASASAPSPASVAVRSTATKPAAVAAPALSLMRTRFTVSSLPYGLSTQGDEVTASSEAISLGTPSVPSSVMVSLVASDGWHPAIPAGASVVRVGGRTGYYATNFDLRNAPSALGLDTGIKTGLSWRDASGDWVFMGQPISEWTNKVPLPLAKAQLVNLANVVRAGQAHAIRTPAKIGYLPAGATLDSVDFGPLNEQAWAPAVNLSFGGVEVDVSPGTWLTGVLGPRPDKAPQTRSISVNGFTGDYSPQDPSVVVTNGTLTIVVSNLKAVNKKISDNNYTQVVPGNGLPLAEVTQILNGITITKTPHNQLSWYDLQNALP